MTKKKLLDTLWRNNLETTDDEGSYSDSASSHESSFGDRMSADSQGQCTSPTLGSRYLNDFEETKYIGHGGFGHVVQCRNKVDGRKYAVKMIPLTDEPIEDKRILREVATLSKLQHQNVVRYYQAWFDTGYTTCCSDSSEGSIFSSSNKDVEYKMGRSLYIQMEYCPRTLKGMLDSYFERKFDEKLAWHMFRQIVEGLAHIHSQGIIHRDLTPNNIFFDDHDDIKIGDFGLAKFLKLEQLDQNLDPAETTGLSPSSQIGTHFYTAPEIRGKYLHIDEKADMYSLGIIFLELWYPLSTSSERYTILTAFKDKGELPSDWAADFPEQATLLRRMTSSEPSDRPSATEVLQHAIPPRIEVLNDILCRMHNTSGSTTVYNEVVKSLFCEEKLSPKYKAKAHKVGGNDTSYVQYIDLDTQTRDQVSEASAEVFKSYGAKRLEFTPITLLGDSMQYNRNTVKLLSSGGDMLELCHELRLPFINWLVSNQKSSYRRFEIGYVYRKQIAHSPPNRHLQGDFDVIGDASVSTEALVIKATMDILKRFYPKRSCDIHLNHADLLEATLSWTGIVPEHRKKVAELFSLLCSWPPQSTERKNKWEVLIKKFKQEVDISKEAEERLQKMGLGSFGNADMACFNSLRDTFPADKPAQTAVYQLSEICKDLCTRYVEVNVYIDPLMAPPERYHRDSFFQIYLRKDKSFGSPRKGTLLAVGGRYDYLLHKMWGSCKHSSNPPGAVGTSLNLETIIRHYSKAHKKRFQQK